MERRAERLRDMTDFELQAEIDACAAYIRALGSFDALTRLDGVMVRRAVKRYGRAIREQAKREVRRGVG